MPMLTPFQTVGPFLRLGLRVGTAGVAVPQGQRRLLIRGRLVDGNGQGIPDGVLELWHPALPEFQRALVDDEGAFVIETMKPSAIPGPEGRQQAPHFVVRVLGRGILTQYITRMYFADESQNAADPILSLVPEPRRQTLIAMPAATDAYTFDVVVQGERETVFFDV